MDINNIILPILIGGISVIVLDTLGSIASCKFNFKYSYLLVFSMTIYFLVGNITDSQTHTFMPLLTAGFVGLIDATIGWKISWALGAGKVDPPNNTVKNISISIVLVCIFAAIIGLVGSLFPRFFTFI